MAPSRKEVRAKLAFASWRDISRPDGLGCVEKTEPYVQFCCIDVIVHSVPYLRRKFAKKRPRYEFSIRIISRDVLVFYIPERNFHKKTAGHRPAVLHSENSRLIARRDAADLAGIYFPSRSGAIFLQASTRVCTASTDLSNPSRSLPERSISTMRSTPLAPITTGTPTYMSFTPYSPLRWAAQGITRFLSRR